MHTTAAVTGAITATETMRPTPKGCRSPIYCSGPLLDAVQTAQLFADSKAFVDMPTTRRPEQVLAEFAALLEQQRKNTTTTTTTTTGTTSSRSSSSADNANTDRHIHATTVAPDVLRDFVRRNFRPPGSELVRAEPRDWHPRPALIDSIRDPAVRAWARALHRRWRDLLRRFDHDPECHECYSSLPVKRPFLVPGGRFLENYYWDTYWVIQGLLVSEMFDTTKDMLLNLLDMVETYGFVPNGARVYYLNRSQPPLLSSMVKLYVDATKDNDFLRHALPILDKEYRFWMRERTIEFNNAPWNEYSSSSTSDSKSSPSSSSDSKSLPSSLSGSMLTSSGRRLVSRYQPIDTGAATDWPLSSSLHAAPSSSNASLHNINPEESTVCNRSLTNNTLRLTVYRVEADGPRPESYIEDLLTAQHVTDAERNTLFSNLATGAESGWDYSSRWLLDGESLASIRARDIVPVDLNAIMYMNERVLSEFHRRIEEQQSDDTTSSAVISNVVNATEQQPMSSRYAAAADARRIAIHELLFDHDQHTWLDLNWVSMRKNKEFYVSNLFPIWADAVHPDHVSGHAVCNALSSWSTIFGYPGGVPASMHHTGQQWDFPNAWAPLQSVLLQLFDRAALSCPSSSSPNTSSPSHAIATLAENVRHRWLVSNFCAWRSAQNCDNSGNECSGPMYEKYDVTHIGRPGGGGEYLVQDGFGWTNGVALALLAKYGPDLDLGSHCPVSHERMSFDFFSDEEDATDIPVQILNHEQASSEMHLGVTRLATLTLALFSCALFLLLLRRQAARIKRKHHQEWNSSLLHSNRANITKSPISSQQITDQDNSTVTTATVSTRLNAHNNYAAIQVNDPDSADV